MNKGLGRMNWDLERYKRSLKDLYFQMSKDGPKAACSASGEQWSEIELARFLRDLRNLPKAKRDAA